MKSTSVEIIEILKKAGHQAYWAGGCVRDMLLGIEPKDFDIVTSAKPDEIEALLENTIPVGKEFGVILAIKNKHHFEVATFRSDSGYSDGRRPDYVEFTDAREDAQRRDFTINAMFYDPTTDEIFDYVDGRIDLRDRLIRFIGDPELRIQEDNLRILRAVRFKNNFNFQYHPDTYAAIKKYSHLISNISKERVKDELNKMIAGKNAAQGFEELLEIGALEIIMPELCKLKGLAQPLEYHREGDVWDHSLNCLRALTDEEIDSNPLPEDKPSLALLWATLFHDIGKYETFSVDEERIRYDHHASVGADIAKDILKRLQFPKKIVDRVHWLISHHMMMVDFFNMPDGRRRHWFLQPGFLELLEVYRADAAGTQPIDMHLYDNVKKLYNHEIAKLKLMPKSLLSGEEVMKILNLKQGERIGEILADLREKQLNGDLKNSKEAKEYLKARSYSLPS